MDQASARWQRSTIDAEKKRLKQMLDQNFKVGEARARLRFVLGEIHRLADDTAAEAAMQRYVLVVTALVHHQRHGGLEPPQVRQLSRLGAAILEAEGIKARSSRLSFLHGEVRLILSQIHRREGRQWDAAWEQLLGGWLARGETSGGRGFAALGYANRALRLGNAHMAADAFIRAEGLGLSEADMARARLGRIKALRLARQDEEVAALIEKTRAAGILSGAFTLELEWENLCAAALRSAGALEGLKRAVQRDGSHRHATYILETYLWHMAAPRKDAWTNQASIRHMARDKSLNLPKHGLFYRIALAIERSYDPEEPLAARLTRLGRLLGRTRELISVDKELLVWAAASRWLARSKSYDLAAVALAEYAGISYRLTRGASGDVLSLMGDMLQRDWYVAGQSKAAEEEKPLEDEIEVA